VAFLDPRARILGGLAVLLAVGAFAVTYVLGTSAFADVPTRAVLVVAVAFPGSLLGRTGVPGRVGIVAYEALLAYATGAVVATGTLATTTYALASTSDPLAALSAFAIALTTSWAPWGVAGYAFGLATTVVETAAGR
jgi:hypothetical protein